MHPGDRCVLPGSLGSLGSTLCVVGFMRGRWVHSGALKCLLGSSGALLFNRVRVGDCWVHPGSLGSLGCAFAVVGFIRVYSVRLESRWVHMGAPWNRCVHSDVHWVSLGSSGVVRYTRERPWGVSVYAGSMDSLGCSLGVVGFIQGRSVHSSAPTKLLGSTLVVGFIPVRHGCHPGWHSGTRSGSFGSSLVIGFTR